MAAALAAGCGKVVKSERAADAALPDALACTAPANACGSACVDVTSSNDHCGDCETSCSVGAACMAGHCVDNITTCKQLHMVNDQQPSGLYTLIDGTQLYCDMTTMVGHSSLIMAQWDAPPAGYTIVSATDLQNASTQAAFIALYNNQGGFKVLTAFSAGNCCFKNDATTSMMLFLQNADVYPGTAGASACNAAYAVGTTYQFEVLPDTAMKTAIPYMGSSFFTTYPATAAPGCLVDTNPAVFWKVTQ
jgi:hypothetical protein